jgi:hypothetical protein
MGYKYPFIADKRLYAAVMYACTLVRKYGEYNRACNTAAKKYGVSAEDVRTELSKRAGAGHKGAKMKWFVVWDVTTGDWVDYSGEKYGNIRVQRGVSKETIEKSRRYGARCLGGGEEIIRTEVLKMFDSKKQADEAFNRLMKKYGECESDEEKWDVIDAFCDETN